MSYLIIESHFWVPDNSIYPLTRNHSSDELVALIYRINELLYPNEKIEILILPSEPWSYKDILKIIGAIWWWLLTITWVAIAYLTYIDAHESHQIDMIEKCVNMITKEADGKIEIDYTKLNKLCEDYWVKKIKNNRYKILQNDKTISYEETIVKTDNQKTIYKKKIDRENFWDMIFPIPEDQEVFLENMEWTIELIALVVKQKKEWKWIPWKGTYYWDEIEELGYKVLYSWEEVSFYMQDKEFKNKIQNHEITFMSWDNISVLFNLKWTIKNGFFLNKNIYIKEVRQFNEKVIEHTQKITSKKVRRQAQWQISLEI